MYAASLVRYYNRSIWPSVLCGVGQTLSSCLNELLFLIQHVNHSIYKELMDMVLSSSLVQNHAS